MPLRAKASAVAVAALACLLLAPAAMASSGPTQFTGRQLKAQPTQSSLTLELIARVSHLR